MDWDGENIWAAGDINIYCLSTNGRVVSSFDDPLNPSMYVAYDSDEDILYLAGTTTHIFRCDREGNLLEGYVDPPASRLRKYGLAYWPEDPDGYKLYIMQRPSGNQSFVTKMNIETGDTVTVFHIPQDSSSTGQLS